MNEVLFLVEDSVEGDYEAQAFGKSIFTEGETIEELKQNIREAVRCHFDEGGIPLGIRLHYVKEEMISL